MMEAAAVKTQLQELADNLIKSWFDDGMFEGWKSLLDDQAIAFGPFSHRYIKDRRDVLAFLKEEYDKLSPCRIARLHTRMFGESNELTAESYVMVTSIQLRRMLIFKINIMFETVGDTYQIVGVNVARDYKHEGTYNSVSAVPQNSKTMEYLASYDGPTGLLNRDAFFFRTTDMLADYPDKSFDMLRINIDRFKIFNEVLGEAQGDKLLKYIAKFLKSIDLPLCVTGRLYADNFVMCYEAGNGDSERLMRTMQVVADSFDNSHKTVLSFGLYRIDDRSLTVSAMCERANMALNQAKGARLTPFCEYDSKMGEMMVQEQRIVNNMEDALKNKEFSLYLQPKYESEGNTVIGAEALVRWWDKDGNFVSPGVFIPVFEKNGFVYEVDKFIWEETCKYIRKWLDEGLDVKPISVNVSRLDLYDANLLDFLKELRDKYNLPHELLELEITETSYTEDPQAIIEVTERLRREGFAILMDDFGSGYSSLNMLKDIHIDVLKLDMGFIRSNDKTGRGGNILSAVVQMAKSLNLSTIAEGVETEAQVEFLRSIGCTWIQGYYYSKPLEASEYGKLLNKKSI